MKHKRNLLAAFKTAEQLYKMDHNLLNWSTAEGHLGCFKFLAITNNTKVMYLCLSFHKECTVLKIDQIYFKTLISFF